MNPLTLTTRDLVPFLHEHAERFSILTDLLIEENKIHNLTRITDPPQIRLRHILDSLIALKILDPMAESAGSFSCADIGSGAGFPVLPLAMVRPHWSFLSVEATGKKAFFQRKVCKTLGLSNVQVVSARAEDLAHDPQFRSRFNAVLARAVADLSILAELSLAFVKPGGTLIAWKGPDIAEELRCAQKAFEKMGALKPKSVPYLLEDAESGEPLHFHLVVVTKQRATPDCLPRPYGQIKKQTL